MNDEKLSGNSNEIKIVLELLEEWGKDSKFIWFREIDRQTGLDRGLLRNILNSLKKSKEVKEKHGQNKRIFYSLSKYYKNCFEAELKVKGKILSDNYSKAKGLSRTQKSMERTKKRIERQQKRREVKLFAREKHKRKINS